MTAMFQVGTAEPDGTYTYTTDEPKRTAYAYAWMLKRQGRIYQMLFQDDMISVASAGLVTMRFRADREQMEEA